MPRSFFELVRVIMERPSRYPVQPQALGGSNQVLPPIGHCRAGLGVPRGNYFAVFFTGSNHPKAIRGRPTQGRLDRFDRGGSGLRQPRCPMADMLEYVHRRQDLDREANAGLLRAAWTRRVRQRYLEAVQSLAEHFLLTRRSPYS